MSLYLRLALLAVGFILFSLVRAVVSFKRNPTAPGPRLAAFTHWWLVWKFWEGDFSPWNIKQHAECGPILRVAPNMYSIDDPEAVKVIYGISSPLAKNKWFRAFGDPMVKNHNLFSAQDNKVHAQMRRMVASMYSMTTIKSYESYVDNCIWALLSQFDRLAVQGDPIDLQRWMQCYAFDVIGEITFSHRIGFLDSGGKDVENIMHGIDVSTKFSTILGLDFRLFPLLLATYGNPIGGATRFANNLTKLRKMQVVEETVHRNAEDFFSKLEKLREKDPDNYQKYSCANTIQANVSAGSDTTSISLTANLYYLLKNRSTLKKLREEISEAVARGEVDEPITFDQAQKLPYLQAVIKESMRLHPAVGLPQWRIVPEGGLNIAGTYFPEKCIIGINPWVASHNAEIYGADHNEFRPERWMLGESSQEKLTQMEKYYLTWGTGTRTCAGKHIATLEMMKLIPELVRRYDFELLTPELVCYSYLFVRQRDLQVRLRPLK